MSFYRQTNGRASLIDTTEIDLVLTGPMIKVYMKVTYIKEDARNINEFTDNDITQIGMETKSIYKVKRTLAMIFKRKFRAISMNIFPSL